MSPASWTLYKLCTDLKVDQGYVVMLAKKALESSHEKYATWKYQCTWLKYASDYTNNWILEINNNNSDKTSKINDRS